MDKDAIRKMMERGDSPTDIKAAIAKAKQEAVALATASTPSVTDPATTVASSPDKKIEQPKLSFKTYGEMLKADWENMDYYFIDPENGATGSLDGLGSFAKGASQFVAPLIEVGLAKIPIQLSEEEIKNQIKQLINSANKALLEKNNAETSDAKTTLSFAQSFKNERGENKLAVANVGDSRVYVIRNGEIHYQTLDQKTSTSLLPANLKTTGSLVTSVERSLNISREDAGHRFFLALQKITDSIDSTIKSRDFYLYETNFITDTMLAIGIQKTEILHLEDYFLRIIRDDLKDTSTRCLGDDQDPTPQIDIVDIAPNDLVLTFTDGVTGNLTTEELLGLIEGVPANKIPKKIINEIEKRLADPDKKTKYPRTKSDDTTLTVMEVGQELLDKITFTNGDLLSTLNFWKGIDTTLTTGTVSQSLGVTHDLAFEILENGLKTRLYDLDPIVKDNKIDANALEIFERYVGTNSKLNELFELPPAPLPTVTTPYPVVITPTVATAPASPSTGPSEPKTLDEFLDSDEKEDYFNKWETNFDNWESEIRINKFLNKNYTPADIETDAKENIDKLINQELRSLLLDKSRAQKYIRDSIEYRLEFSKGYLQNLNIYLRYFSDESYKTNNRLSEKQRERITYLLINKDEIRTFLENLIKVSEKELEIISSMSKEDFDKKVDEMATAAGISSAPSTSATSGPMTTATPGVPPTAGSSSAGPAAAPSPASVTPASAPGALSAATNMAERLVANLKEKYKNYPRTRNLIISALFIGATGWAGYGIYNYSDSGKAPQSSEAKKLDGAEPKATNPNKIQEGGTKLTITSPESNISSEILNPNYQETRWWKEINPEVKEDIKNILNSKDAKDYNLQFLKQIEFLKVAGYININDKTRSELYDNLNRIPEILNLAAGNTPRIAACEITLEDNVNKEKKDCYLRENLYEIAKKYHRIIGVALNGNMMEMFQQGQTLSDTYNDVRTRIIKEINTKTASK